MLYKNISKANSTGNMKIEIGKQDGGIGGFHLSIPPATIICQPSTGKKKCFCGTFGIEVGICET